MDRWRPFTLMRYRGVWDRSHPALTCRLRPERIRRGGRVSAASPFTQHLTWIEPDDVPERRFVMAGLPGSWPWAAERRLVRAHLKGWKRIGLASDVREVRVPAAAYALTDGGGRAYATSRQAERTGHLNHHALAVDAALMLVAGDAAGARAERLVGDAELQAAWRRRRAVKVGERRGTADVVFPDVEVTIGDGATLWVEVLSENYRNTGIVQKRAELPVRTRFVAPSAVLARRAARLMEPATIAHF